MSDLDLTLERVELIRQALLDDSVDVRQASDTLRKEAPGTAGLLHYEVAHEFYAERGQGKSSVAAVLGMSHAAAGGRTFYLDRENAPPLSKARLYTIMKANGWPDLLKDERFVGRHYPSIARWEPHDVAEAIAGLGFTGVVYDSLREFLGQLGLNPDKEEDLTVFFNIFVTPLLQRGLWVLLPDNVGHQAKERPKGSSTKLDAAAQGYLVQTTSKFSPETIGAIKITCKRSRYGDEDKVWKMRLGGGLFEVPNLATPTVNAKRAQDANEDREACRKAAIDVLTASGPQGRDPLVAAIRKSGLRITNERIRTLLPDLASDPTSGIEHGPAGYRIAGTLDLDTAQDPAGAGPKPDSQGTSRAPADQPETALECGIDPGHEQDVQGGQTDPGPLDPTPTGGSRADQATRNGSPGDLQRRVRHLAAIDDPDDAERQWHELEQQQRESV
jgi:hypothetical protein